MKFLTYKFLMFSLLNIVKLGAALQLYSLNIFRLYDCTIEL